MAKIKKKSNRGGSQKIHPLEDEVKWYDWFKVNLYQPLFYKKCGFYGIDDTININVAHIFPLHQAFYWFLAGNRIYDNSF